MGPLIAVIVVVAVLALIFLAMSLRIVQQYEEGVLFRLGRVRGVKKPGLARIIPIIDVLRRVSLRIVTMPIQSQGIITRDNVSVDVSAVAYYKVVDATKSVIAIESVVAAIDQIAQTTLRKVVGQHTLDETLVGDRPDQREHPGDPRRADRGLGCGRDPGRAQGHPAPREHEAGHGPTGRGGTREAGQDHRRRRRVTGRGGPGRGVGHDDGAPAWPCSFAICRPWSRSGWTRTPRWSSPPPS